MTECKKCRKLTKNKSFCSYACRDIRYKHPLKEQIKKRM